MERLGALKLRRLLVNLSPSLYENWGLCLFQC